MKSAAFCLLGLLLFFAAPAFASFHDNGNGTVTDSRTGLVWQQIPLDADGNGAADALTWQEALAAATKLSFAGQSDWRLPNRNELQSIVDYRYADPAIDSNVFPKVTAVSGLPPPLPTVPATPTRLISTAARSALSAKRKSSRRCWLCAVGRAFLPERLSFSASRTQ
ncbi:MAG: Lcl C-terminal domain-containing protein [Candidatus Electronema sp. VV]